jgi:hypothetical protein
MRGSGWCLADAGWIVFPRLDALGPGPFTVGAFDEEERDQRCNNDPRAGLPHPGDSRCWVATRAVQTSML